MSSAIRQALYGTTASAEQNASSTTASALLPRLPVRSPERADWIVTWGIPPERYDVPLAGVRVVGRARERLPEAYLARVAG